MGLKGLAILIAAGAVSVAPAAADDSSNLLKTALPYWKIGELDKGLSRQCSVGKFNQRMPYQFTAHFDGLTGAALLGGAKGSGLNLSDPLGLADPAYDYWFYRDGTPLCEVFRAPVRKPAR